MPADHAHRMAAREPAGVSLLRVHLSAAENHADREAGDCRDGYRLERTVLYGRTGRVDALPRDDGSIAGQSAELLLRDTQLVGHLLAQRCEFASRCLAGAGSQILQVGENVVELRA